MRIVISRLCFNSSKRRRISFEEPILLSSRLWQKQEREDAWRTGWKKGRSNKGKGEGEGKGERVRERGEIKERRSEEREEREGEEDQGVRT